MKFVTLFLLAFVVLASAQELSVTMTSPAKNARFESCSDIVFAADWTSPDGTIRKIDYYVNGARKRSATRSPYEFEWTNVVDGVYLVYAKVIDMDNNEVDSEPYYIFVGDVQGGDVILNGDFNCGLAPWFLDNYEGAVSTIEIQDDLAISDDSPGVFIDIDNKGAQFWSIQLMQPFKVKAGKTYTVTFVAMADAPKNIYIDVSRNYDDYAPIVEQVFAVSDLDEYGPWSFTPEADDDNMMFKFVCSEDATDFYLDNVIVIESDWTGVKDEQPATVNNFALAQNYPNPFNPSTRIDFDLQQAGQTELAIYNLLGTKIASFSGYKQAGHHAVEWNGQTSNGIDCASGVYLYRLTTDSGSLTKKMQLIR